MKNTGKRALSYLCILALLFGLLPPLGINADVLAASKDAISGNAASDEANVYVTIAIKGQLAVGEDEDGTLMANVPVSVTDKDGDKELTFNDAMLIVHDRYCKGGYAAGDSPYGFSVTKLWGDDSGAFGYYINGASPLTAKEKVSTDDVIIAYVYSDTAGWTDKYSAFDNNFKDVKQGEEFSLHLGYSSWDGSGNASGAFIGICTKDGFLYLRKPTASGEGLTTTASADAVTTDSSGNATVAFPQAGRYVLSAKSDSMILVPPVCIANVERDEAFQKAYNKGIEYIVSQAQSEDAADVRNVWNIINLQRSDSLEKDVCDKYVANARKYVKEKKGIVEAKYVLALCAVGVDVTDFEGYNLLDQFMDYDTVVSQNGITALAYIVMALNAKPYSISTGNASDIAEKYALYLAEQSLENGGWSYGSSFDADSTAMVLQSLAPYYKKNDTITKEIDKALDILSSAQEENGGFKSSDSEWQGTVYPGASNSCTTAMVWLALSCLGISEQDKRFVKNEKTIQDAMISYQLEDGSFCYQTSSMETNSMATYQGMQAFISAEYLSSGKGAFYDFKNVNVVYPSIEDQQETEPSTEEPAATTQTPATTQAAATTQAPAQTTETTQTPATTQEPAQTTEASESVKVKKQKIKRLKAGNKKIQVIFTKNTKASGYQIQYSTSKKFVKSATKTIRINKVKINTYTIKKCKRKKTYYVRVRSFKKVGQEYVYGKYSAFKKVYVK